MKRNKKYIWISLQKNISALPWFSYETPSFWTAALSGEKTSKMILNDNLILKSNLNWNCCKNSFWLTCSCKGPLSFWRHSHTWKWFSFKTQHNLQETKQKTYCFHIRRKWLRKKYSFDKWQLECPVQLLGQKILNSDLSSQCVSHQSKSTRRVSIGKLSVVKKTIQK